jgi:hypothetical protein
MSKFGRHKWWLVTLLLSVPLVALATVPHVFTPGTVISSGDVNANFAALDQRITALENATPQVSVVMSNKPGPLGTTGITGSFQSSGGPLLIIVSGSSYSVQGGNAAFVDGTLDVAVQLDGKTVGDLVEYTNEGLSHKALPTRAFWLPLGVSDGGAPPSGTHTLGLLNGNTATTNDANDYFSATVVEMHH